MECKVERIGHGPQRTRAGECMHNEEGNPWALQGSLGASHLTRSGIFMRHEKRGRMDALGPP